MCSRELLLCLRSSLYLSLAVMVVCVVQNKGNCFHAFTHLLCCSQTWKQYIVLSHPPIVIYILKPLDAAASRESGNCDRARIIYTMYIISISVVEPAM